jgi:hypothetical protein
VSFIKSHRPGEGFLAVEIQASLKLPAGKSVPTQRLWWAAQEVGHGYWSAAEKKSDSTESDSTESKVASSAAKMPLP